MLYDVATWYLSVVPVLVALGISALANTRLGATARELGGAIRSHGDLVPVRQASNYNKRLAWAYIALWLGQLAAVAAAAVTGLTTFPGAVGHVFAFGVLTLPAGLWTKRVEGKFRALAVEGGDPALARTYQRYLADWKKPSFSIPE